MDSSLIYIDSNRVHKLNLDQEGLHIRLSVDYLIYLKTKSKLNAYIGLGAGFNQSITNNLNTNYRAESFIRSNPYNPSWPSVRENLDIVSSQSIHSLKNNSQLQVRLVLGVQCLLSKNERLAGFMEFQPGLSANFQKDYKNSIGNTWLSRLGLLYTFKKKIQKGQTDI